MSLFNRLKLVLRNISRRIFITALLLCINFVSFYMVDTVGTRYFQSRHAINKITNMFGEEPENVSYISAVVKTDRYSSNKVITDYIKTLDKVEYSGFFSGAAANDLIDGESVDIITAEKSLENLGNLKLTDELRELMDGAADGYEPVMLGSNYRGRVEIGDVFTVSIYEEKDCIVAGFLEEGASWPKRGKLFNTTSTGDAYILDNSGILLTENYDKYDTFKISDGACEYYFVTEPENRNEVYSQIREYALQNAITVQIVNVGDEIEEQIESTGLTSDNSFLATAAFILLAVISMSAVSVVYCILDMKAYGTMSVCGMKKCEIISMTLIYNGGMFLASAVTAWLVRQREVFGSLSPAKSSLMSLFKENYIVGHMYNIPVLFICMIVIMALATSIIPAVIISKTQPVEMIFDRE